MLAAAEREVIVTYNDAEKVWHVYSDSSSMRGAIRKLAQQAGAEIIRVGDHGIEFTCPAGALRIAAKRRARRTGISLANLRKGTERPDTTGLVQTKVAIPEGVSG